MKFAVIGGDMRIARLCRLLINDGEQVSSFALEKALPPGCAVSPGEAAAGADCVVLPLPAAQGDMLSAPLSNAPVKLRDVISAIAPGTLVCAGRADKQLISLAEGRGLILEDYFLREDFTVSNAMATAEGAVEIILREMPRTLCGSRVLVVGFGRIGKFLARDLLALGADVAVSSRDPADKAWCASLGYSAMDTRCLDGLLGQFDAVVNTVPAAVLGKKQLSGMQPGTLCLDLASAPGGIDPDAAKALGIRAMSAPGLPGKTAPESAAEMICSAVRSIINERKAGIKQ